MIVALAGGVGGAKLALGLSRVLPPDQLTIVVNTGDDFEHLDLHVSPDLDTVMYTLAGIANPELGWGRADESWNFMEALQALGGESWFRLGDRDLAVNVERTHRLRNGEKLSAITARFANALNVRHQILPMSDDPVRTVVVSGADRLPFQHYFVRLRCVPRVDAIEFAGAADAKPPAPLQSAIAGGKVRGVILCPSNPFLSIDPILSVPAIGGWLRARQAPVVAVSPIVGGAAIKGPAAKIFRELGRDVSALGVARHYAGLVDGLLIDRADAALGPEIEALGMRVAVGDTIMRDLADRERVARETVALLDALQQRR